MSKTRTVFAGTPEFAVPALRALLRHAGLDVVAVYTQPDRPSGRGRKLSASAVKRVAMESGIEVAQPASFNAPVEFENFAALQCDVLVVAAYGLLLPAAILELPAMAPLNIHASLLPKWRGAAPIQRAIMAGDEETGISIMRMVERLDAGPVWLQRGCRVHETDTGGQLHDRLAALGAALIIEAIDKRLKGPVTEQPQDDTAATYAPKITRLERALDWRQSALSLERQVRALNPAPSARCRLRELEVKVLDAYARAASVDAAPGTLVVKHKDRLEVATGDGVFGIRELQPPGKSSMSLAAFMNGYGSQL